MAKSTIRVKIPGNANDQIALAEKIYAKHQDDGADSPLNLLEDDNWTDNGPKIEQAKALQLQAKQMEKDLEKLYQLRDQLLSPLLATIKASRDALLAKYSKTPKKLGDWAFQVDDSPKAKTKATGSK